MSKRRNSHDHGRGKINDNALAALVTSKTFKSKVENPKKGKGTKYSRKSKHKRSLDDKFSDLFHFFPKIRKHTIL